jgi:hypothetical protein
MRSSVVMPASVPCCGAASSGGASGDCGGRLRGCSAASVPRSPAVRARCPPVGWAGGAPCMVPGCVVRCRQVPHLRGSGRRDPGGLPEWSKGAVCKTAGSAYVGSNPTPATVDVHGLRFKASGSWREVHGRGASSVTRRCAGLSRVARHTARCAGWRRGRSPSDCVRRLLRAPSAARAVCCPRRLRRTCCPRAQRCRPAARRPCLPARRHPTAAGDSACSGCVRCVNRRRVGARRPYGRS